MKARGPNLLAPALLTLVAVVSFLLAVGCGTAPTATATTDTSSAPRVSRHVPTIDAPRNGWTAEKQARHVLDRLAYGARPGEVESLARAGVAAWIKSQMKPASLPDGAVAAKLRGYPSLEMSIAELNVEYPRPQAVARQAGIPRDDPNGKEKMRDLVDPTRLPRNIGRELVAQKLVRAVESTRQLQEVLTDFWFNHFNVFLEKGEDRWMVTSYERDAIRPNVFGNFRDLLEATASHPAMLWYLDNWVSTRDGLEPRDLYAASRPGRRGWRADAMRPRSAALNPAPKNPAPKRPQKLGLNENYARELLELHTMGVDGGYTQQDVREVARCFTGWSIDTPRAAGTFTYRDVAHDKGAKSVLGHAISAGGGREDGEKVLDLLVAEPATARFVATKLCRKFIADVPPASAVDRVAAAFHRSHGDLPTTYAALFSSPEFWSDEAFESKTKTPLELAISAVRALGGTTTGEPALAQQIARMGEPLYQCQPPTGYKETADAWVNTGALVARLSFSLQLAAGKVTGVSVDTSKLVSESDLVDPNSAINRFSKLILHAPVSAATRETVLRALASDDTSMPDGERRRVEVAKVAGLLLGSPEFQKR